MTVAFPLVRPETSMVSAATITPMQATDSSVCACVISSATASRNTPALAKNAALFVTAVDGAGQAAAPPLSRSALFSSLRKQSVK